MWSRSRPREVTVQGTTDSTPRESPKAAPSGNSNSRFGVYAALCPLFLLLILWLWLFLQVGALRSGPSGKAFGADFAMFLSASQILKEGGNPYDHVLLYRTERAAMNRQHLSMTPKQEVVRVGNPPLFLWSLEPISNLPFQPVAYIWMASLAILSLAGFLAALSYLGWTVRIIPSLIFLAMPATAFGIFYGNVICVVFGALGLSLLLLPRFPAFTGAVMTVAWLKPPVALPLVLLFFLFGTARPRRFIAGFAAATVALIALTVLTSGDASIAQWLHGLTGYSQDMGIQPDVASLAGLYVLWAPHFPRLLLEAISIAGALALTAVAWRTLPGERPRPLLETGWLWFVWLLASPYAHYFDLMLLAVPVAAMLGRNGERVTTRSSVLTLYVLLLSLLFIDPTPFHVYLLPLPMLAVGVMAYRVGFPRPKELRHQPEHPVGQPI